MAAKKRKKSKIEEEATSKAIAEAIEEMEVDSEDDENFDLSEENDLRAVADDYNVDGAAFERDVFSKGNAHGMKLGIPISFREYVNGALRKTIPGPYSWEQYREDHPDDSGIIKIVAVDANNKIVSTQVMRLMAMRKTAPPEAGVASNEGKFGSLEMMEVMKENQREAEAKAQSQQNGLAAIMSTVIQVQQQSSQMMMQMMQESSKQTQSMIMAMMQQSQQPRGPDPMMTLVTTLLTKDKPKEGMGFETVLKLLSDKERDTRQALEKQYELIEKKSEALAITKAEAMTAGEGGEEEGGLAGLAKGFIPILAQIAAQRQPTMTPEQELQMRIQAERQASGANMPQNFVPDGPNRPAIGAPAHMQRPRVQRPANAQAPQGPAPQREPRPAQPVNFEANKVQASKDPMALSRLKERILAVAGLEVVQGRAQEHSPGVVAERCLIGLEKEQISRQTVANTFKLEDFHEYAKIYGVTLTPEDVEWLKEFYEYIQVSARPVVAQSAPVVDKPATPAPAKIVGESRVNGSGGKPVTEIKPRAGARSGGSPKGVPERNI